MVETEVKYSILSKNREIAGIPVVDSRVFWRECTSRCEPSAPQINTRLDVPGCGADVRLH